MAKPISARSASCVFVPLLILMLVSSVCGQTRRRATARNQPGSIRSVDFLNRTHPAKCAERRVKVVNGKYAPPSDASGPYFELHVSVIYGDLTGDGQEEAVVMLTCDGAVGSVEDGTIYTLRQGRAIPLADIESGNRGDGGDIKVKIARGLLSVERNVGMAACCAELRETITYKLVGRKLNPVGKAFRTPLEPESKPAEQRIEFAAGRHSATIEGTLEPDKRVDYLLRASKGQNLDVKLNAGESDAAMIVVDSDEHVVGEQTGYVPEWQGVLPATGEYKIIVEYRDITSSKKPASYKLDVSIR